MTVRRLVPADAPAYRALMLDAYTQHPDAFTSSAEERAALPFAWWEARLATAEDAHEVVLGAFAGDALVGVFGVEFEQRDKARHKVFLFGMYVAPQARRGGVGAELVAAALATARARAGVRIAQLTVTAGNRPARDLYERAGFVAFGEEPYAVAVGDDYVAKLHMWCDLGLAQRLAAARLAGPGHTPQSRGTVAHHNGTASIMTVSSADREARYLAAAHDLQMPADGELRVGGHYAGLVEHAGIAYISGQLPRVGDRVAVTGRVGADVSLDDAQRAARICAMRALGFLRQLPGGLARVQRVLRMTACTQSAQDFTQHSEVADAASDLLHSILGDAGVHARTSVGVFALPKNAAVEIDFIVALTPEPQA